MKAVRVHRFGGPEALSVDELPTPTPGPGEVLVRVRASGVGPWDAWIRSGRSVKVDPSDLPITLGGDIAGVVERVGAGATPLRPGDRVFGVTNGRFTGGYASHAIAEASRLAAMPATLTFEEAASLPVIAVTAWRMLSLIGPSDEEAPVVVLGASGNVGAALVQLARLRSLRVIALGASHEAVRLYADGAQTVIDERGLEDACAGARVVLDTVGGEWLRRSLRALPTDALLVSIVEPPDLVVPRRTEVRFEYFIVDVRRDDLNRVSDAVDRAMLKARVGTVLPLEEARRAHEMIDGLVDHPRGKIVLLPHHDHR